MPSSERDDRLTVREATLADVSGISALVERVYPTMPPYPDAMLRGQINAFPEGVWVAVLGDLVVGYCATLRIAESKALTPHNWREITGGGYGSTHDATGDYLYGYEVCVDPRMRRYRIGHRFYRQRRRLCEYLRLKGIVLAGRIPNYSRNARRYETPEAYVEAVKNKQVRDPVLGFQMRMGYEPVRVLHDYLPVDRESGGFAVQLVWHNPQHTQGEQPETSPARASYRSALEDDELQPHEAIATITRYEDRIVELFRDLAVRYNVNIIGGSTPALRGERVHNVCHVFRRDGTVATQEKIHPTPNERYWWNIEGGDELNLIDTDCGPIGVLICYDSEFPELTRHLVDQGINILFVPFLTDERQSYCRVRFCAQARAVENQIYVVLAGSCGNLPNVKNIDIHYAQSCILTPCDFPFSRDGVAADTTPNVEMVAFADLSLRALREARQTGTVLNLKDRRHDLYSVIWHGKARHST
jgi:predicted amidohydrolase/GNAT superfamily N-acetyltransferase